MLLVHLPVVILLPAEEPMKILPVPVCILERQLYPKAKLPSFDPVVTPSEPRAKPPMATLLLSVVTWFIAAKPMETFWLPVVVLYPALTPTPILLVPLVKTP